MDALPPLPAVIQHQPIVSDPVPIPAPAPIANALQYILCITKDLSDVDINLFKAFNVVHYDDNVHKNIAISSYPFDVLVLDLRLKGDRYTYMKEVEPNRSQYKVVIYCYQFENADIADIIPDADNVLNKLPEPQAVPKAFLEMMLVKRIKKPRWYFALFKCMVNGYSKIKN